MVMNDLPGKTVESRSFHPQKTLRETAAEFSQIQRMPQLLSGIGAGRGGDGKTLQV